MRQMKQNDQFAKEANLAFWLNRFAREILRKPENELSKMILEIGNKLSKGFDLRF